MGARLPDAGRLRLRLYYLINDEARRYLADETIKPIVSLLAILIGWIIIVPPFVSY